MGIAAWWWVFAAWWWVREWVFVARWWVFAAWWWVVAAAQVSLATVVGVWVSVVGGRLQVCVSVWGKRGLGVEGPWIVADRTV